MSKNIYQEFMIFDCIEGSYMSKYNFVCHVKLLSYALPFIR